MIEQELRKAGLTGNEAKIYLELVKTGTISANKLAKKISIDRTLTYTVLNNLIGKGLVKYVIKENKKHFQATDPKNLLNPIKEKEAFIKDLIPELKSIEKITETKHEINIYEGKQGVRTFIRDLLKEKKFYIFGATGKMYDLLYESPAIAKEAAKLGINAKIITNPKFKEYKFTNLKGIKTKFLNIESKVTTIIFGDKISLHLLTQKPVIIIIKNKEIAEGYKNYFDWIWKNAK